jgi:disulfide bond formation protein DsbB
MDRFMNPVLRQWPVVAFLVSAAMLAVAHAFQTFGGLAPCTLCLQQRDVYWAAMAVAAVAIVVQRSPARRLGWAVGIVLCLTFLTGAFIAARHAGAEWKWWPGPATCSSDGAGASAAGLSALMNGGKVAAPRCDQAAWRMFGLSMAGYNFPISLALAGLSGWWSMRTRKDV